MKIYELLATPDKWTQGYYAKNKYGDDVEEGDDTAVCWCLMGAIYICYEMEDYVKIMNKIESRIGQCSIPSWNDSEIREYSEVIDLCKELDI